MLTQQVLLFSTTSGALAWPLTAPAEPLWMCRVFSGDEVPIPTLPGLFTNRASVGLPSAASREWIPDRLDPSPENAPLIWFAGLVRSTAAL
jgi:hypothetical protein